MNAAGVERVNVQADNDPLPQVFDALIESQGSIVPCLEDGAQSSEIRIPYGCAADQDTVPATAGDLIRSSAADDDVSPGAPDEGIRIGVADDKIVADAADYDLDTNDAPINRGGKVQGHIHGNGALLCVTTIWTFLRGLSPRE